MPQIKVILVKNSTNELESAFKQGWKIVQHYAHAQGALFVLVLQK